MIRPKTWLLIGIATVLLAFNLFDQGSAQRISEQLPAIAAFKREEVSRVEISSAVEKVVLKRAADRGDDAFDVVSPFESAADAALVQSLLMNYRKDIPVDVRVDQGNLEDYGLDATDGVVFEVWTAGDEPVVSFTLGNDAPGGSTFIRLSGEDAVYRARIGGRARYSRPATDWRNKVLLGFEKDEVAGLTATRPGLETLHIVRQTTGEIDEEGNPKLGDWALEPDPGWLPDQAATEALVRGLGRMRAGEILDDGFDGGFDPPAAEVEVVLHDGSRRQFTLGTRTFDGAAFVRIGERKGVFRVADAQPRALLLPLDDYRDRTMLAFSRRDVDTIGFEGEGARVLLQQDFATSLWNIIEPQNIDIDMKLVFFAVNTLASLRAHDVVETSITDAGLDYPTGRVVVRFVDGRTVGLELGARTQDKRGRPCWFARVSGATTVYLLEDATVTKLKQGFGRS